MNIFTIGQKNRMRTVLEIIPYRASLLNSPGCCGGGQLALIPLLEDFEIAKQEFSLYNPGLKGYGKYNLGAFGNSNSRQPRLLPLVQREVAGLMNGYQDAATIMLPALAPRSGVLGAIALAETA